MKKSLFLLLVLLLVASSCYGQSLPQNRFHRKVWNATMALYGYSPAGGVGHFMCTATVFSKSGDTYKLLTASHCIAGEDLPTDLVFYVNDSLILDDAATIQKMTPAKVLASKRDNEIGLDCAVLEIKSKKKYPVIPLGDESSLRVESKIFYVNFSEGTTKQLNVGTVSSRLMNGHGSVGECHNCPSRYLIQAYGAGGASGGAIVDEKTHKIVGIMEGGYSDGSAQIVPISHLRLLTF